MSDSKASRDTSSNSNSPIRKNSTSSDVSDSARELAQNALTEFNKNNLTLVISLLTKLQSSRPKDIKVLSNKAVVDYYITGLKKTEAFQKALSDICNQSGIKFGDIKSTDEVEASVIRLNRCTVLFHLQQLNGAKALLESMYKGLESLEESVSIGLCLLLAEVLLGLSLPGGAFSVVAYTEATFLPQPLQPQSASTKLHCDKDSTKFPDRATRKENVLQSGNTGTTYKRTNIITNHDNADNDSIGGSSEMRCSADQELLRCKIQMLRVRSLLQIKVLKAAKKEMKSLISHAVSSGNSSNLTLVMLKSQLEYQSENYKKSLKLLNQCSTIPSSPISYGPSLRVAYYNNLGLIHVGLKKPTLACLYFKKSLQELKIYCVKESSKADETPLTQKLYSNWSEIGMQLCYNLGITLMMINKFTEAFDFLVEVVKSHSSNLRLWLRLAECCIGAHKMNLFKEKGKSFRYQIIGSGDQQKIILDPDMSGHNKKLNEQQTTPDPALPVPTLEFGRLCLQNCLSLIPEHVSTDFLTEEQEASGILPDLYPCTPTCPMKGPQILQVHLQCLSCLSYSSLCLGDYLQALKHSLALLALLDKASQYDPMLKLLGHFYAGESLVLLGRFSEAEIHFDPKHIGEMAFVDDKITQNSDNTNDGVCSALSGSMANKILYYNLSVAFALQKQFKKSYEVLRKVLDGSDSKLPAAQAIMLALYLNIQLGYTESFGPITEKGLSTSYI